MVAVELSEALCEESVESVMMLKNLSLGSRGWEMRRDCGEGEVEVLIGCAVGLVIDRRVAVFRRSG